MDTMGVYEFALGLFGVQIDFIGLPRRIDYCGPSIGCIQPLVLDIKSKLRWLETVFHFPLQLNFMKGLLVCNKRLLLLVDS